MNTPSDAANEANPAPRALLDALHAGKVVVVAGAGISMLQPSNLPSWWGFNQTLLESMKQQVHSLLPEDERNLLDKLSLEKGIPVVAFSDLVVRTFAGGAYFPLLKVLESAKPNANHRALAWLAGTGRIKDIVTLNFDSLTERAFREAGEALEVLVRSEDYGVFSARSRASARLHKIHGSVTDTQTLVDTVSQKASGLSAARRSVLEQLFSECHVLLIGFSGADLDFDLDYLPLRHSLASGLGFTWLYRKGSRPPDVGAQITSDPSHFLEANLPDVFRMLGVDETLLVVPERDPGAGNASSLREEIEAWTCGMTVGPWACAALCLRLMHEMMYRDDAARFEALLVEAFDREAATGYFHVSVGAAMRQLSVACLERLDFAGCRAWGERELGFHQALIEPLVKVNRLSPEARTEYLRNTASVFINLANAWHSESDDEEHRREALRMLELARERASELNDAELLALIEMRHAKLASNSLDDKLAHLRAARRHAQPVGASLTVLETLLLEAGALMRVSELDLAQMRLDEARQILVYTVRKSLVWRHAMLSAELSARRGELDRTFEVLKQLIDEPWLDFETRLATGREMLRLLGNKASLRASLLLQIDASFPESLDGNDLTKREGESLASIRSGCKAIAGVTEDFEPWFLIQPRPDQPGEARMRYVLAGAEYTGNVVLVLQALDALCRLFHQRGSIERLTDLAQALRERASRSKNTHYEIGGANFLGIALEYQGRIAEAAQAYERTIADLEQRGEGDSTGAHMLRSNFARVLGHDDAEANRAIALFESSRQAQRRLGDWDNYMTSTVNQARLLCQLQRNDEAIELLTAHIELTDKSSLPNARERLIALIESMRRGERTRDTRLRSASVERSSWNDLLKQHEQDDDTEETAPRMATRAMAAYEDGRRDDALRLNKAAREIYARANDKIGESRCWNNLAEIHAREAQWDEAARAAQRAHDLREAGGDVAGQIKTLSNLMEYLLRGNRPEDAYQSGKRLLALAGPGMRMWEVAKARVCLIDAALKTDRLAEAERMLPDAVEALTAVEHSARGEMLERIGRYRQLLEEIRAAPKRDDARVGAAAMQAIELARQQSQDAATRTLTAALNEATNSIDQATLHGEMGNRLAKTDPQAAQMHYEQSRALYEAAGHSGMAWYARCIAERMRVDQGADPDALLKFADECPVTTVKLNALAAYGGVLLREYEEVEVYSDAAVDAVSRRIEEALSLFDTEPEQLGQTALQLTYIYMMKEDLPAARRTLERARVWLVRANSTYLNDLEVVDRQLREEGV
ncbi:SIR2 family protein [Paraburkholderia monticola]|nr:SIR2 family protein [Paraburkholderia monticola]